LTDTPVEPGPGPLPAAAITSTPDPAEEFARQLALASEYEAAGRLDEAETLLNRLLAENSDRPRALHLLGIVAFRKGPDAIADRYLLGACAADQSRTRNP